MKKIVCVFIILLCVCTSGTTVLAKELIVGDQSSKVHEITIDGVMYSYLISPDKKEVTILEADTDKKFKTFRYPSKIKGKPVTKIGGWVNKPDCYTTLVECKKLIVPSSVRTLHHGCFIRLKADEVVLPETIKTIPSFCFQGSTIKKVNIPKKVKKINSYAFWECRKLKAVNLPDGLQKLGEYAFAGCQSITKVTVPKKITKLEDCSLCGCMSLKKITFKGKLTAIGGGAFCGTRLEKFTIPNTVKSIGDTAFAYCDKLKKIVIPKQVTVLKQQTFDRCKNLETVIIKAPSIRVERSVFRDCKKLKNLSLEKISWSAAHAFDGTPYAGQETEKGTTSA